MGVRHSEGSPEDAFHLGLGDTAFATGSGEKLDLMSREPAANGPRIDAEYRSYLARAKVVLLTHALTLQDIADIK